MAQALSDTLTRGYKAQAQQQADITGAAIRALWQQAASGATSAQDVYDRWIDPATDVVVRARAEQAAFARAYYTAMRRLESPKAISYLPKPLPPTDRDVIRHSLYFMAFVEGRPAGEDLKDYPMEEVLRDERLSLIEGSVIRHTMNGGRLQVRKALDDDPAPFKGYYRELGPDPCGFCALLGTRHDYGENSFDESDARFEGPGQAKVHDHCHCTMRPYWVAPALGDKHLEAEALWKQVSKDSRFKNNEERISEYSKRWRQAKEQAATMNQDRTPKGRVA